MRYRDFTGAALIAAVGLGGGLSACASEDVYYYQRTTVGIDATASTADASGGLTVGYRRKFMAYVPPVQEASSEDDLGEAMSVVSCVDVQGEGLFQFGVEESVATGAAARNYARQLASGAATPFDCFEMEEPEAQP